MLDNSRRAFSGYLPFLPFAGGFDNEMRAAMVAVLVAMGVATLLSLYVSWKQSKELAKLERAAEDVATILSQERHHHDYFEAQEIARAEAASESSESTCASMPALVPASDNDNDINGNGNDNNDINNDINGNDNNNNMIDDDDDDIHILSASPKKSAKSVKKSAKSAIAAKK